MKIPLKQANEADVVVPAYPEGRVDDFIEKESFLVLYDKYKWLNSHPA